MQEVNAASEVGTHSGSERRRCQNPTKRVLLGCATLFVLVLCLYCAYVAWDEWLRPPSPEAREAARRCLTGLDGCKGITNIKSSVPLFSNLEPSDPEFADLVAIVRQVLRRCRTTTATKYVTIAEFDLQLGDETPESVHLRFRPYCMEIDDNCFATTPDQLNRIERLIRRAVYRRPSGQLVD